MSVIGTDGIEYDDQEIADADDMEFSDDEIEAAEQDAIMACGGCLAVNQVFINKKISVQDNNADNINIRH